MPWKECEIMDERIKFVGRLLSGEKMAPLCREFEISRVTGHKIWKRYKEQGERGLINRSRCPKRQPNKISFAVEQLIVRLKKEKPNWGAPKLREVVATRYPDLKLPATSTVHCVLDRHGLVNRKKRKRKFSSLVSYLSDPKKPNDLWCTDFKGQFKMKNKSYCYPLTITDQCSRFILGCEALDSTAENPCFPVFDRVFKEYGLPTAMRSDNGIPFASGNSLWGLTKLSVWWVRLGIKLERIAPGNPQQNGRHERMHRTLKAATTKPPASNQLQQQEVFDKFLSEFNQERPHQALEMKRPKDVYESSSRPYAGLEDITYPDSDKTLLTSNCGRVCIDGLKIHLSKAFAYQPIGITQEDEGIWAVRFMDYDLGFFDEESKKFSGRDEGPIKAGFNGILDDPFGLKLDMIDKPG